MDINNNYLKAGAGAFAALLGLGAIIGGVIVIGHSPAAVHFFKTLPQHMSNWVNQHPAAAWAIGGAITGATIGIGVGGAIAYEVRKHLNEKKQKQLLN